MTLGVFFLLVMVYLLQHLSAIEYGYRIEQAKAEQNSIVESNRELKLEESSLKDLERIDLEARKLGMIPPVAGQVQIIESGNGDSAGAGHGEGESQRDHGGLDAAVKPGQQRDGLNPDGSSQWRSANVGPPSACQYHSV